MYEDIQIREKKVIIHKLSSLMYLNEYGGVERQFETITGLKLLQVKWLRNFAKFINKLSRY